MPRDGSRPDVAAARVADVRGVGTHNHSNLPQRYSRRLRGGGSQKKAAASRAARPERRRHILLFFTGHSYISHLLSRVLQLVLRPSDNNATLATLSLVLY